jgi:hypothetical protein
MVAPPKFVELNPFICATAAVERIRTKPATRAKTANLCPRRISAPYLIRTPDIGGGCENSSKYYIF